VGTTVESCDASMPASWSASASHARRQGEQPRARGDGEVDEVLTAELGDDVLLDADPAARDGHDVRGALTEPEQLGER
jgi:hypothetical protein